MMQRTMTYRSGQTLVEVMVALFVLTTGFLGILSLLAQSIAISKNTNTQTIGTYLAEEGLELAKSAVDHDMYQRVAGWGGWAQGGLDPTFPNPGGANYQLDYTFCNTIAYHTQPCGSAPADLAQPLDFNPANNLYSYNEPVVTPFTRKIKVAYSGTNNNELIVDSIVTWSSGALTSQSVDLQDIIYNWRP